MQIANQTGAVPIAVTRHTAKTRLGALRPAIGKVFVLDDVAEAHRHLEKGLHDGKKIVVTV